MIPLVSILALASWCDIRQRRIPNCVTYAGLVIVFLCAVHTDGLAIVEHSFDVFGNSTISDQVGSIDPWSSVDPIESFSNETFFVRDWSIVHTASGCLSLAIPMLILYCYGGIGGGDVKLAACIGAYVGPEAGFSILIIGHVLAGIVALFFTAFNLVSNCRAEPVATQGSPAHQTWITSRGVPMACFYFIGTLLFGWGVY